jgi:hypothetical protein
MRKSALRKRTGWATALLASATALLLFAAAPAFAQDDPAPPTTEEVTAAEPAPAPAVEPAAEPAATPVVETPVVADPVPVVALAPAPESKTALDNLSSEVMNILVPVFAAFIAGLFSLLLNWLRKKFKLEVSEKQIGSWSHLARKGALRGAEWARKKVKSATEGKKLPGPEILEVATNWAVEAGKAAGLPEMGREKLEGWIEAELFDLRREENGETPTNPI